MLAGGCAPGVQHGRARVLRDRLRGGAHLPWLRNPVLSLARCRSRPAPDDHAALQFGHIVLTTSQGIMDHEEARRKHTGGKVLGFFF